jgi:hypothetical protein
MQGSPVSYVVHARIASVVSFAYMARDMLPRPWCNAEGLIDHACMHVRVSHHLPVGRHADMVSVMTSGRGKWRDDCHCAGTDVAPPYQQLAALHTVIPEKARAHVHHSEEWHTAPTFLAYCLYPPLYLTGPTITYNDFVCQSRKTQPTAVRSLS